VDEVVQAVRSLRPDVPVFRTVFRPRPLESINGARVFLAMTAPEAILPRISTYLETTYACTVVGASSHLSDRPKLRTDLAAAADYDVLLVELKAAGIDVGARTALAQGRRVVFVDNEPVADSIELMNGEIIRLAREAVGEHRSAER